MFDRIAGKQRLVLFHIFVKLSRLYDSHCGQLFQTRVPRKFETAVGAVIRVVLSTMFHRWKATDVVHERMFGYSGRGHICMEFVIVADQERQCSTGQVRLHVLQSVSRIT